MKVVIIGARLGRDDAADKILVNQIIDACREKYSKLLIITKSGDKGVGKFILDRCRESKDNGNQDFDMIELSLRHILRHELPKQEFLGHFNTLNAALLELGDEFHLLTEEYPTGAMLDMIDRVKRFGVPYAVYKPSEVVHGPKELIILQEK